jgi:hypothetical protein
MADIMKTMMLEVMPRIIDDLPKQGRPINLEIMPRLIDDMPKQGKPINMEIMPRTIDDIRPRELAKFSVEGKKEHAETIKALHELRTELKALVTTQSGANPQLIERLENIERRLAYMERDAKLKPA